VPRRNPREYASRWDVWYRFTYFVIYLYDFDSHEPLLAAGQGRDNLVSNEEIVVRDTFAEIARALGTPVRAASTQ
jgi:hypothetical protein